MDLGHQLQSSLTSMVIVVDGDAPSGLQPELTAQVAEISPELPPVALAVVGDPERGRVWTAAGAGSFLLRPVDPEDLQREVKRWLRFSDRLRGANRQLEALRKFFAMFAHDLKNPLSAISGYCELASTRADLPGDVREDLEKVRRNIDLLSTMSQGLLEMARGNARLGLSLREADLCRVVKEAVEMMSVRAHARKIAILVRPAAPQVLVRVDPPRIIEALANVLDNAIKFSPEHSVIEVSISTQSRAPDEPVNEALITIDDEGPGVPPADREKIFNRFAGAPGPGQQGGLGLGLSIARQIFELHGGSIAVEGRSPAGTRMAIRLPLGIPKPDDAAPPEAVEAEEVRSREGSQG
jgi:signal transduction histidine kinase